MKEPLLIDSILFSILVILSALLSCLIAGILRELLLVVAGMSLGLAFHIRMLHYIINEPA